MSGGESDLTIEERLAREIGRVLEPIAEAAAAGPEGFAALESDAGLTDALTPTEREKLRSILDDAGAPSAAVADALSSGAIPSLDSFLRDVDRAFAAIRRLGDLRFEEFDDVGVRFLEYLLVRYLRDYHHTAYAGLALFGVVDETVVGPARLRLERIPELLRDPAALPKEVFGWARDVEGFLAFVVLYYLKELFWGLGVPASLAGTNVDDLATLTDVDDIPDVSALPDGYEYELKVPVVALVGQSGTTLAGVKLVALPGDTEHLPGMAVVTFGTLTAAQDLPLSEHWTFNVRSTGELGERGFAVQPRQSGGVDRRAVTFGAGGTPDVLEGTAELKRTDAAASEEVVLAGQPGASRIAVRSLSARVTIRYRSGTDLVFAVEVPATGVIGVHPSDFDGFLAEVMPRDGIFYDFGVTVGWSSRDGLYFEGSGTLSLTIPQHRQLGPAFLREIYLELEPTSGAATTTTLDEGDIHVVGAASLDVSLGPLTATVKQMGVTTDVAFRERFDGEFGPFDLGFGFKPPTGVGVDVDAPGVSGGGYLEFDRKNERYAGVLRLRVGTLSLTAVGLLTTRLPDGRSGFSLLVIITGEFPPVQLGYGFTLNGLGGLLGINRSFKTEPLRSAVRAGTLDSVMFPRDPIANAQRIVSDLRSIFPPVRNVHVFGPLARLGWGTPPIITADLGIILELPSIRIALLGRIDVNLPTREVGIIELHMDVAGILDPPEQRLSIDSNLYDSRVVAFPVDGEMAMRLVWGDRPVFVLSVGGFHPRFTPPDDVGQLKAARISLGNPSGNPSIELTGYFALTSNTAQVGAHARLRAEAGPAKVSGHLGFDALFQFNPFAFGVDFVASLEVKVSGRGFSIKLDGTITGPRPYRIQGEIRIKVLFFKIKASLDVSIGPASQAEPLATAAVLPALETALSHSGNWTGELPQDHEPSVTLRRRQPDPDVVLAHPLGRLSVRQTVVPLSKRIEKFGNATPADYVRFTIDDISVSADGAGSITLGEQTVTREQFAPADYEVQTGQQKLESPGFVLEEAGRRIENDLVYAGGAVDRRSQNVRTTVLDYEETVIDERKENYVEPIINLGRYVELDGEPIFSLPVYLAESFAEVSAAADHTALEGISFEDTRAGGPMEPTPVDEGPSIDPSTGLLNANVKLRDPEYVLVTADDATMLTLDGEDEVSASKGRALKDVEALRAQSPVEAAHTRVVERWRANESDAGGPRDREAAFGGVQL